MKNEKFLIAVLTITAVILSALCLSSYQAETAYADSSSRVPGGNYIMVNGAVTDSHDLIYVVDVPHQRVLVYATDSLQNSMTVVDQIELSNVFRTRR